jgi:hypothetical protein
MGLYKGKVQHTFTGSYILPSADDKGKDERIKGEGTKKGEEKKLSIKKYSIPRLGLGGLTHKKRRKELSEGQKNMSTKNQKIQYMGQICLWF